MPEQQKQPKRNKKQSLCPMSFDEALEKIVKAGPHPKDKKNQSPKQGKEATKKQRTS